MIDQNLISKLLAEKLEGSSLFVCEIQVNKSNVITVYLDGDHGVNVDHCTEVSRFLESRLDRDKEDFDLSVSSFGADRPLVLKRQFPQHLGRTLQVTMKDESEIVGTFDSFDEHHINLIPKVTKNKKKITPAPVSIPFEYIKEAIVVISFN